MSAFGLSDIPKYSNESELAFLGSILLSPEILKHIIVEPYMMYSKEHSVILESIIELNKNNINIDIVNLGRKVSEKSQLDVSYLAELMTTVPTAVDWKTYEASIIQDYEVRKLEQELKQGLRDLKAGKDPIDIKQSVADVKQTIGKVNTLSSQEMLEAYCEHIDKVADGENDIVIPTGIGRLDDKVGGLFVSGMTTVGAPSKGGKSLFVSQVISNVSLKYPTLYCSLEMPPVQIVNRWVAQHSELINRDLQSGKALKDERLGVALSTATEFLDKRIIFFAEDRNFQEIRKAIIKHSLDDGVKVVVIDYAQLVSVQGFSNSDQRLKLEWLANELKALAMECEVAIIFLSQVNAEGEFFGSQAMKFASDTTLKILPEKDEEGETIEGDERLFKVEYSRHSEPCEWTMRLDGDHQKFI